MKTWDEMMETEKRDIRRSCTCVPCTTPAYGAPWLDHCAACCYGSLISEYDLECPVPEHQELARRQWGIPAPLEAS